MGSRRTLARVASVVVFGLMLAGAAQATPIKPDLKKLLTEPPPQDEQLGPARAGWDGPELAPPENKAMNAMLAPQPTPWQVVRRAAMPDWRALVALLLAICGLRLAIAWRQRRRHRGKVIAMPAPLAPERKVA